MLVESILIFATIPWVGIGKACVWAVLTGGLSFAWSESVPGWPTIRSVMTRFRSGGRYCDLSPTTPFGRELHLRTCPAPTEVYNPSAPLTINKATRRTYASITVDVGDRFGPHRGMVRRTPSGARGQSYLR